MPLGGADVCRHLTIHAKPSREIAMVPPMLDAITQNTPGYSQAYPAGVPASYSWCNGVQKGSVAPPAEFSAVTGWGQIYQQAGAPASSNPNATVHIANARTYVHLKAVGQWVLVQNQATDRITGAHFVADFSGNRSIPMTVTVSADGSADVGLPPAGYNAHFWVPTRGTYDPGTVDGVYVQMDMRVDDPEAKLVANVGADWWRDSTAEYVNGFKNNPGAGMSNWVALSTRWSTFYFYSVSTARLEVEPPPPLAASAAEAVQAPAPRPPSPFSPCRPGVQHQQAR